MNKTIVSNERTHQQYTYVKHPSGLDIMIWRMPGFSGCKAFFGTKYGSVNTMFKTEADKEFTVVPEGIAHFLEHKLFENEECDTFELYAKTGASANAYTSFDKTVYLFECTKNFIPSLEILLTFVQNPYFTQATVDKEQGIIGQEIRMCEDSVERAVFFNLLQAMFVNHPVKIEIAGTIDSIAQIDAELLYKCYNTFYNLNNMALVIAGNVDEDEILEVCDRLLKPCRDVKLETSFPEEPLRVAKERVCVNMECGSPLFEAGFKLSPAGGKAALEKKISAQILLQLLADQTTELYTKMTEEGLINSSFEYEVFCGDGYFTLLFDGESKDPDEVFARIKTAIADAKKTGLDSEHFDTTKRAMYGAAMRGFNNVGAVATLMIESKFAGVDPFDEIEILAKTTLSDVEGLLNEIDTECSAISIVKPTK